MANSCYSKRYEAKATCMVLGLRRRGDEVRSGQRVAVCGFQKGSLTPALRGFSLRPVEVRMLYSPEPDSRKMSVFEGQITSCRSLPSSFGTSHRTTKLQSNAKEAIRYMGRRLRNSILKSSYSITSPLLKNKRERSFPFVDYRSDGRVPRRLAGAWRQDGAGTVGLGLEQAWREGGAAPGL